MTRGMTPILWLLLSLALPNLELTPGVVRPLTVQVVCAMRWGVDRRHVTEAMRRHVLAAYGLTWEQRGTVEIDHLVPRELGGADDILNLWPQVWAEARVKDRAENAAHRAVCAGTLPLKAARTQMRRWGR